MLRGLVRWLVKLMYPEVLLLLLWAVLIPAIGVPVSLPAVRSTYKGTVSPGGGVRKAFLQKAGSRSLLKEIAVKYFREIAQYPFEVTICILKYFYIHITKLTKLSIRNQMSNRGLLDISM